MGHGEIGSARINSAHVSKQKMCTFRLISCPVRSNRFFFISSAYKLVCLKTVSVLLSLLCWCDEIGAGQWIVNTVNIVCAKKPLVIALFWRLYTSRYWHCHPAVFIRLQWLMALWRATLSYSLFTASSHFRLVCIACMQTLLCSNRKLQQNKMHMLMWFVTFSKLNWIYIVCDLSNMCVFSSSFHSSTRRSVWSIIFAAKFWCTI